MKMEEKKKESTGDIMNFCNIPVRELSMGMVIYESPMIGKVDDVLNGIINGIYYKFVIDEIKEFAVKENKFVNVLVGFRHIQKKNDKGRIEDMVSIIISCINELHDVSDVRKRLCNYVVYDSKDLRKLMGPRNDNGCLIDVLSKSLEIV